MKKLEFKTKDRIKMAVIKIKELRAKLESDILESTVEQSERIKYEQNNGNIL